MQDKLRWTELECRFIDYREHWEFFYRGFLVLGFHIVLCQNIREYLPLAIWDILVRMFDDMDNIGNLCEYHGNKSSTTFNRNRPIKQSMGSSVNYSISCDTYGSLGMCWSNIKLHMDKEPRQ